MHHSEDKRLRWNTADFQTRKCGCQGKVNWFSVFTESKSNTNSKNYSKESKGKSQGSTAWFVGSLSLKVFKNRLSDYEQKSMKGGWPSFRTLGWLNLQRPLPGQWEANTLWHSEMKGLGTSPSIIIPSMQSNSSIGWFRLFCLGPGCCKARIHSQD